MKIVINSHWGGFSLSEKVIKEYEKRTGKEFRDYYSQRSDPVLIEIIEKVGVDRAGGGSAKLKIVEVPDGIEYTIFEYDGIETIVEKDHFWN